MHTICLFCSLEFSVLKTPRSDVMKIRACKPEMDADQNYLDIRSRNVCASDNLRRVSRVDENLRIAAYGHVCNAVRVQSQVAASRQFTLKRVNAWYVRKADNISARVKISDFVMAAWCGIRD
jgi:hypothetical protein